MTSPKPLTCALGLHAPVRRDVWTPSMMAPIVREFEQTHTCSRCGKLLGRVHWRWDGAEMVEVVVAKR